MLRRRKFSVNERPDAGEVAPGLRTERFFEELAIGDERRRPRRRIDRESVPLAKTKRIGDPCVLLGRQSRLDVASETHASVNMVLHQPGDTR